MKQISLSKGAEINVLFIRKYPMASKAFRDLDKEKNGVISRSQFLKVGDTHAHTFFFFDRVHSLCMCFHHLIVLVRVSVCVCVCLCLCVSVTVFMCLCTGDRGHGVERSQVLTLLALLVQKYKY